MIENTLEKLGETQDKLGISVMLQETLGTSGSLGVARGRSGVELCLAIEGGGGVPREALVIFQLILVPNRTL